MVAPGDEVYGAQVEDEDTDSDDQALSNLNRQNNSKTDFI